MSPEVYGLFNSHKSLEVNGTDLTLTFVSHVMANQMIKPKFMDTLKAALLEYTGLDYSITVLVNDGRILTEDRKEKETPESNVNNPQALEYLRLILNINPSNIDYQKYIQSPEWKEKALKAKERTGWRCQICNRHGDRKQLHAHHRTYERLGNELPEDITVLCPDCHEKFHGK